MLCVLVSNSGSYPAGFHFRWTRSVSFVTLCDSEARSEWRSSPSWSESSQRPSLRLWLGRDSLARELEQNLKYVPVKELGSGWTCRMIQWLNLPHDILAAIRRQRRQVTGICRSESWLGFSDSELWYVSRRQAVAPLAAEDLERPGSSWLKTCQLRVLYTPKTQFQQRVKWNSAAS
jgi:hypothetical protein